METEEELTNLLKRLQVTYNTLNHYTTPKKNMVEWANLEYSKKFIYERLETAVAQLNRLRMIKETSGPLHSTIMGAIEK